MIPSQLPLLAVLVDVLVDVVVCCDRLERFVEKDCKAETRLLGAGAKVKPFPVQLTPEGPTFGSPEQKSATLPSRCTYITGAIHIDNQLISSSSSPAFILAGIGIVSTSDMIDSS